MATARFERPDVVTLEMGGAIEFWTCREDGSIAIVLTEAVRCWLCGTAHFWFVNRDGRTKCIDCDSRCEPRSEPAYAKASAGGEVRL